MPGQTYTLKTILSCVDQLSPALKNVRKNVRVVDRVFSNVTASAASLATKLAAPLAAIGGAGLFSLRNAVQSYSELGGAIDDAAQRAGVAIGALQSLRFAAQMGGMQAEQMDAALGKLSQRMGMAADGKNKDLVELFKQLGISWKDSEGNVRSAAEVMRELAEAVRVNENASDRLRILSTAFGDKMAQVLVPVLQDGAQGLDEMAQKAREMGLVFSSQEVQAAAKFGDTLDIFNSVIQSVSFSIGSKLAPVLERLITRIQSVIIANRELIAQRIEKIVTAISEALERVDFESVINGLFDFVEGIAKAIDSIGGMKNILYVMAGIMGASVLANIMSLATGIWSLVPALGALSKSVLSLLGPWGILAGALATLLIANWDKVMAFWEDLKSTISEIYDWIVEKVNAFRTALPDWIFNIGDGTSVVARETNTVQNQPIFQKPIIDQGQTMDGTVNIRVTSDEGSRVIVENAEATGGNLNVENVGAYSFMDS